MSHQKKQRTRIEDLSVNGNELFELSEQMMMMVGGGYDGPTVVEPVPNTKLTNIWKGTYENNVCELDELEVVTDD